MKTFLTICVFMLIVLSLAAQSSALSFDEAKKLAQQAAKERMGRVGVGTVQSEAIGKTNAKELPSPPKAEGDPVVATPGGSALSIGELMMLEAKISDSPAAINILHDIVKEGRPITEKDRDLMLEVAWAEEARRMYERLVK